VDFFEGLIDGGDGFFDGGHGGGYGFLGSGGCVSIIGDRKVWELYEGDA
jgi:hypothetical protein